MIQDNPDAAGAVRRTPRPDEVPELWWSPTVGLIQKMDSFYRAFGGGSERWWGTLLADQFPADAVQLAAFGQRAELTRLQRLVERLPYRQRDYLRARLELRKLNDAMARKNRIIDKRSAERDALQARLDEIRTVLAEDAATRARFQVDTSTSYGPRFLSRIRAIVERAALQGDQPTEPGDDLSRTRASGAVTSAATGRTVTSGP